MRISAEASPAIYDGAWFGSALAVYFAAVGDRAPVQSIWIVALSAVAYLAAWWTVLLSALAFEAILSAGSFEVCVFLAGAVGGLMMSAATTFRLYAPDPGARRTRQLCALAGGLLGVAGYMLAIAPDSKSLSTPVLCIVWQTGMGLVLGLTAPIQSEIR